MPVYLFARMPYVLCTSNVNVNPGRIRMVGVSDVLSGKAPVFFFMCASIFCIFSFAHFARLQEVSLRASMGTFAQKLVFEMFVCLLPQVCANVV